MRGLSALEAAQHFVAIGIVGGQIGNLRPLLEGMLRHRSRGHVWVQRFMEGEAAEVLDLVDGVGLADRDVDDAASARYLVHGELDGAGKRADDGVNLVLLDQFECAGCCLAGVEFVVAHQKLDLAACDAALVVDELDGEFRALDLILGLGGERPGQRRRKADADRLSALCALRSRASPRATRLRRDPPRHRGGIEVCLPVS